MSSPCGTDEPWRQPTHAPALLPAGPTDFEALSEPALVVTGRPGALRQQVAIYRADLEDPDSARWVSDCSEGWTLEGVLVAPARLAV